MSASHRGWIGWSGWVLGLAWLGCAAPWAPEPPVVEPYEAPTIGFAQQARKEPVSWTDEGLGPHGRPVTEVTFSPDTRLLITADRDQPVLVWSVPRRRLLRELPHDDAVRGIAHHPTEPTLIATGDRGLWQWDLSTGRKTPLVVQEGLASSCLALSPDGGQILTGSAGGRLFVWRRATGERRIELRGVHQGYVNAVAWNGQRPLLASGGADGVARIWNAESGDEVATIDTHRDQVRDVAWSRDGSRLAIAVGDINAPGVWIWDATARQLEHQHSTRYAWVDRVAWSPRGDQIAVARGQRVEIWLVDSGRETQRWSASQRDVGCVAWSPDAAAIAYGSDDGWARLVRWGEP